MLAIIPVSLAILIFKDLKDEYFSKMLRFLNTKAIRWCVYIFLFCSILLFGVLDGGQFIYGQF